MLINYTSKELDMMARLMRAEALAEGNLGMLMVGNVIVNRAIASCYTFKNIRTIADVVNQSPGGFSGVKSSLYVGSATTKEKLKASSNIKSAEKKLKYIDKELKQAEDTLKRHKNDPDKTTYQQAYDKKHLEYKQAEKEVELAKLRQKQMEQLKRESDPNTESDELKKINEAISKYEKEIEDLENKINPPPAH